MAPYFQAILIDLPGFSEPSYFLTSLRSEKPVRSNTLLQITEIVDVKLNTAMTQCNIAYYSLTSSVPSSCNVEMLSSSEAAPRRRTSVNEAVTS